MEKLKLGGIYIKIIESNNKYYPKRLLEIKNHPKKLYVEGNYRILNNNIIAIVGSRKCSKYGWEQSMKFAEELSANGICIISGMALGIDKAAHIGAKKCWGKTIAVLGGGFNSIYPEENKELFYEIIENGGCVITEHEPNEPTKSTNFPKRNRIISGMAIATLVVEATYRSGSLITAKNTINQKKTLFCIPSNINSKNGEGTNNLIKSGALLVTDVNDIFEKIGLEKVKRDKTVKLQTKNTSNKQEKNNYIETKLVKQKIKKEYRCVYDVLNKIPITVNEISKKSNKTIAETNNILTMLELQGVIKSNPGNEFSLK